MITSSWQSTGNWGFILAACVAKRIKEEMQKRAARLDYVFIEAAQHKSTHLLGQIARLRHTAWSHGMSEEFTGYSLEHWIEPLDIDACLWIIMDDYRPVASGRMTTHGSTDTLPDSTFYDGINLECSAPIASLNRLVVSPEYRRLGIGERLVSIRTEMAWQRGARTVIVDCAEERIGSLTKLGFTMVREPLYGVKYTMYKWAVMAKFFSENDFL